ncbi:hydroxyisourate hydrolase [Pseudonocardia endophytica]|uniref:5-hydroxyisourate hydrolase n=1 Tax=Pseudonocardia endophytica TaxID=401976 RepID=A0A4R1HYB5_PSEEN|nr:hydroxyisourate hydrolase [Pseudonocardia endophytica]TCK25860.1 5-hydroxyisourate hydrolase [Pseudonocardia endophytica]
MSTFSTHVLDAAAGRPAAGVPVTLTRADRDTVTVLASGVTDTDGRWRAPEDAALTAGALHRITFETGSDFFPEVAIAFRPAATDRHHHVPLLLSPYAYSTYLGS